MSSAPRVFIGPDHRGRVLEGRYLLREFLGGGGTANVYEGHDYRLGRPVAVKVIHPDNVRDLEDRLRVKQEAALAAEIDHPHVMPLYDYGEETTHGGDPVIYMVMPRAPSQTLRDLILSETIRWRRAVSLTLQILDGLAAIHALGVIHRDLKPSNFILRRRFGGRDQLQILDFGLAAHVGERPFTAPISEPGRLWGSAPYLAPEQIEHAERSVRSDLYSVGVILFELLTRRPPFFGPDYAVLEAHVRRPPPSPRLVAPDAGIPAAIEAVVLRALTKDPELRYAHTEAFAAALTDALRSIHEEDPIACPSGHLGCEEAKRSLAAWTRFEYALAGEEATQAARLSGVWSPLRLLMSDLPPDE